MMPMRQVDVSIPTWVIEGKIEDEYHQDDLDGIRLAHHENIKLVKLLQSKFLK